MLTQTIPDQVVLSPGRILQTGLGFWSSKVLLSAVNMDLFTFLATGGKSAEEIKLELNLHDRSLYDFLDTLVALNFLHRKGLKKEAVYCNTLETDIFLDRNKSSYIGGMLIMGNNRLYGHWNHLEEALKTGRPQNEVRNGDGDSIFKELYADENRLSQFIAAMSSVQMASFIAFAKQFDFSDYYTHCDIGGAGGDLSIQIALHTENIGSTTFDLPQVTPIAQRNIDMHNLGNRIQAKSGNFFIQELPKADIITMGNILHDWNLEEKKMLIAKAYDALPAGGVLVAIENIIDDQRRENAFGLMMSLNMLIETYGGFDYTAADFRSWATEAGFVQVEKMPLAGAASAMIAYK